MRFGLLAMCLLGCSASGAVPRNESHPFTGNKATRLMPLSEFETRLKEARAAGKRLDGYALSVFQGTRVERFDLEFIDILKSVVYPKRDLILARLLPTHSVVEKAGVVAGMSGSPVYLEDRVVGAIGYSMGRFGKEGIAGVTPIEDMLADAGRGGAGATGGIPPPMETGLCRIATPLMVSGPAGRALDRLKKEIEPHGFVVAPSGSGSGVYDFPQRFEPGAAIGAQLVSGDWDWTAIGTVSYVDGDRIIAFAHPFFGDGPTSLPITTAVIHTVFPSLAFSFKLGSAGPIVGTLDQDRPACIAGRLGSKPRMIPVRAEYRNVNEGTSTSMNVQVAGGSWMPILVPWVIAMGSDTFEPAGETVVTTRRSIALTLESGEVLQFQEMSVRSPDGLFRREGEFGRALRVLTTNPYGKASIASVRVVEEYSYEARYAEILSLWPLQREVESGSTAKLRVRFRRWRGPEEFRDIEARVPHGLAPGTEVTFTVMGGPDALPPRPPAESLPELIQAWKKSTPPSNLTCLAQLEDLCLYYRGRTLEKLPFFAVAQLIPTLGEQAMVGSYTVRVDLETDLLWGGSGRTTVFVR